MKMAVFADESSAVFAPNGKEMGKKYISLSVSYKKGGCNSWYSKQEKRGFELVVSSRTATESGFMVTPMDPENFRYFLGQEISRTSKKAEKLAFEDLLFRIDNDEQWVEDGMCINDDVYLHEELGK